MPAVPSGCKYRCLDASSHTASLARGPWLGGPGSIPALHSSSLHSAPRFAAAQPALPCGPVAAAVAQKRRLIRPWRRGGPAAPARRAAWPPAAAPPAAAGSSLAKFSAVRSQQAQRGWVGPATAAAAAAVQQQQQRRQPPGCHEIHASSVNLCACWAGWLGPTEYKLARRGIREAGPAVHRPAQRCSPCPPPPTTAPPAYSLLDHGQPAAGGMGGGVCFAGSCHPTCPARRHPLHSLTHSPPACTQLIIPARSYPAGKGCPVAGSQARLPNAPS